MSRAKLARFAWAVRYEDGLVERGVLLARTLDAADAQMETMILHAAQRGQPIVATVVADGPQPPELPPGITA